MLGDVPVLGIVNDFDCPETKMLVVIWGKPFRPNIHYVNKNKTYKFKTQSRPHFTPLSAFGRRAVWKENRVLTTEPFGECTATYQDGVPRQWQERSQQVVEVKPAVLVQTMKAVRAMREVQP